MYRVMQVKKNNGKWEVESGVEWQHYIAEGCKDREQLVIAPPTYREGWFTEKNPRKCTLATPFQAKLWAGFGEVEEKPTNGEKDLLGSFSIYNIDQNVESKELWEGGGEFTPKNNDVKGYAYVQNVYLKGQGWKKSKTGENISSKLKAWYAPLKDKKIRWSDLGYRCNEWSKIRNQPITQAEEDLRNLCYHKAKSQNEH